MPAYNSQRLRNFANRVVRRVNTRRGRYGAIAGLGAAAYKRAESLYRRAKRDIGIKRKARKLRENPMNTRILGRPLKRPRSMAPPTTTSAKVPAKYAVADRMTKFKKAKPSSQKVPKSAIAHYKEFGQFNAEKCMYINHEHWGSVDKFWYGISLALAKKLLAFGKIYNGKSLEDPCIGPRTNLVAPEGQLDDKGARAVLKLIFTSENMDGQQTLESLDIFLEDMSASPDVYLSMDAVATGISTALRSKYQAERNKWLSAAQILVPAQTGLNYLNVTPVSIQNLDDAEICLYVNSLIKFQNVTTSDAGSLDKHSIDANPLKGRVFSGKGHHPIVDTELAQMGDKTLDGYFGNVSDTTGGITLLGHANTVTANDLGRISHIPQARELYGNQTVSSGTISMGAGAMKFHKTSYTMKKTFKSLMGIEFDQPYVATGRALGRHTMFGFTLAHKHGEDSIKIGYNRDTDVGCYIKHKRIVHPLKTNYTTDSGVIATSVVPTEHS